jgi:hypothetical protein
MESGKQTLLNPAIVKSMLFVSKIALREDKSNLNAALLQLGLRFIRDLAFGVVGKSDVPWPVVLPNSQPEHTA